MKQNELVWRTLVDASLDGQRKWSSIVRALVDSLGYDLEPSILIGGWATHTSTHTSLTNLPSATSSFSTSAS